MKNIIKKSIIKDMLAGEKAKLSGITICVKGDKSKLYDDGYEPEECKVVLWGDDIKDTDYIDVPYIIVYDVAFDDELEPGIYQAYGATLDTTI